MYFEKLYLELTRECTMKCEHCLRGDREHKYMSLETLDNLFKEINHIETLLLSGGEPLLHLDAFSQISELIDKYEIEVDTICIITNGTVVSPRHIKTLLELKNRCSEFKFFLSSDLFHRLEWKRIGVLEKVEENYQLYKYYLSMRKFLDNDSYNSVKIQKKGRAKGITKERIEELSRKNNVHYKFDLVEEANPLYYNDGNVFGKICIDVAGNVVPFNKSFQEEDLFASTKYNVNKAPISSFIAEYVEENTPKKYKKTLYQSN